MDGAGKAAEHLSPGRCRLVASAELLERARSSYECFGVQGSRVFGEVAIECGKRTLGVAAIEEQLRDERLRESALCGIWEPAIETAIELEGPRDIAIAPSAVGVGEQSRRGDRFGCGRTFSNSGAFRGLRIRERRETGDRRGLPGLQRFGVGCRST